MTTPELTIRLHLRARVNSDGRPIGHLFPLTEHWNPPDAAGWRTIRFQEIGERASCGVLRTGRFVRSPTGYGGPMVATCSTCDALRTRASAPIPQPFMRDPHSVSESSGIRTGAGAYMEPNWKVRLGVYLLVALVVVLAVRAWWVLAGPESPHWGQVFECTSYGQVYVDRFNGSEEDCVEGYWRPGGWVPFGP